MAIALSKHRPDLALASHVCLSMVLSCPFLCKLRVRLAIDSNIRINTMHLTSISHQTRGGARLSLPLRIASGAGGLRGGGSEGKGGYEAGA